MSCFYQQKRPKASLGNGPIAPVTTDVDSLNEDWDNHSPILLEREVTREDTTVFKQGQQTTSDLVFKYYVDDLSQPQQHTARNRIGR